MQHQQKNTISIQTSSDKSLLSIVEAGGYPSFQSLYEKAGFEVTLETRMRPSLKRLKNWTPDVVVAEFNFQSDFRDRTSSLESLMAVISRKPATKTIIFYDQEHSHQFDRLKAHFRFDYELPFPIKPSQLEVILSELAC